jgi:hypothetical protein
MKKLGWHLVLLFFAAQATTLFAQPSERPTPWFTLSIEEAQLSRQAGYTANDHELLVQYTNISNVVQQDNCVNRAWVYGMVVLRDGAPFEKRKPKTKNDDSDQDADSGRVKVHSSYVDKGCGRINGGIDPGQTVKFTLWPSAEYDMSEPGTYTITVKRETYPFDLTKSVTVWSNTITIVVPPADNPPPAGK